MFVFVPNAFDDAINKVSGCYTAYENCKPDHKFCLWKHMRNCCDFKALRSLYIGVYLSLTVLKIVL